MKMNKLYKALIFRMSDDSKEIIVDNDLSVASASEEGSEDGEVMWKNLTTKLQKLGEPRYVLFDFTLDKQDGSKPTEKLGFIYW